MMKIDKMVYMKKAKLGRNGNQDHKYFRGWGW